MVEYRSPASPDTHVRLLKRLMGLASKAVVGTVLAVEASGQGLDEIDDDLGVQLDFQTWRETPRCAGYLARLKRWEGRKGQHVLPFRV